MPNPIPCNMSIVTPGGIVTMTAPGRPHDDAREDAMTNRLKRLELTWIGKEERPRLEPRILLEDEELSYAKRVSKNDIFDNRLIHGDNLLALKALEQEFAGKFRCIYIDPPFNTGQAFEHYDDGVEHSIWLTLLRDRLQLLHSLLADDGTLFVHIDDNELGYLVVLLDEIWGRANRTSIVTFKQGAPTGHKAINPGCVTTTNFVLIYAKDKSKWAPNRVFVARERDKRYGQFVLNRDEPHDKWEIVPLIEGYAAAEDIDVDYPLAKAMQDGYVKEPAVATRANFNPKSMSKDALELLKLEDGVRVHESAKVDHRRIGSRVDEPTTDARRAIDYVLLTLIGIEYIAGTKRPNTVQQNLLHDRTILLSFGHNDHTITNPIGASPLHLRLRSRRAKSRRSTSRTPVTRQR